VSRHVDLLDDRVRITWSGLSSLPVVKERVEIPYDQIASAEVGLHDLPGTLTWRVGTSLPFSDRRHGRFWSGGRMLFLDLSDRDRAVVLNLKRGAEYDTVAWDDERPQAIVDLIRGKLV
jgi:hypothetical protein